MLILRGDVKMKYELLELEIIEFITDDVICTSDPPIIDIPDDPNIDIG